jgi:ribosomal subunit interface protein
MKINIVSSVELTSSLEEYAERKFEALGRLVGRYEEKGEVQVWLELKESQRHEKGEIFVAVADMRLMKKVLHAEGKGASMRTAIDAARDVLRTEIEKNKKKLLPKRGK